MPLSAGLPRPIDRQPKASNAKQAAFRCHLSNGAFNAFPKGAFGQLKPQADVQRMKAMTVI